MVYANESGTKDEYIDGKLSCKDEKFENNVQHIDDMNKGRK